MGMFDSVYASCPNCGEQVEFQSKAGPCELAEYRPQSVPMVIAQDLDGAVKSCRVCGKLVELRIAWPVPTHVQMVVD